jgi:hypothetical protein
MCMYEYTYSCYSCLCFYIAEGLGLVLSEILVFVAFGEFFVSLLVLHLNQKDVPSHVTV